MAAIRKFGLGTVGLLIMVLPLLLSACNILETEDVTSTDNIAETIVDTDDVEKHMGLEKEWPPQGEDKIIIRAGIFQHFLRPIYYFTISHNGILEVSLGEVNSDMLNFGVTAPDYLTQEEAEAYLRESVYLFEQKRLALIEECGCLYGCPACWLNFNEDLIGMLGVVEEMATIQLTRGAFEHLIEMVEEIERINPKQDWDFGFHGFGEYTLYLSFNNMFYAFRFGIFQEEEVINCFIEKLIWLSPPAQTAENWHFIRQGIRMGEIQLDRWKRVRFPERPHDGFDGFWWADQIFRLERGFIPLDRWKPNRAND